MTCAISAAVLIAAVSLALNVGLGGLIVAIVIWLIVLLNALQDRPK